MYVECDIIELPEVRGFDNSPESTTLARMTERLAELQMPALVIRSAGSFEKALEQTNELLAPYGICEIGSRTAFVSGGGGLKESRKIAGVDSVGVFHDKPLTLHLDMHEDGKPEVIMWWNGFGEVEVYFLTATQAMHDGYPATDITPSMREQFKAAKKVDEELLVPIAWHTVAGEGDLIIFIGSGSGAAAHVFKPLGDRFSLAVEYGEPEKSKIPVTS